MRCEVSLSFAAAQTQSPGFGPSKLCSSGEKGLSPSDYGESMRWCCHLVALGAGPQQIGHRRPSWLGPQATASTPNYEILPRTDILWQRRSQWRAGVYHRRATRLSGCFSSPQVVWSWAEDKHQLWGDFQLSLSSAPGGVVRVRARQQSAAMWCPRLSDSSAPKLWDSEEQVSAAKH